MVYLIVKNMWKKKQILPNRCFIKCGNPVDSLINEYLMYFIRIHLFKISFVYRNFNTPSQIH